MHFKCKKSFTWLFLFNASHAYFSILPHPVGNCSHIIVVNLPQQDLNLEVVAEMSRLDGHLMSLLLIVCRAGVDTRLSHLFSLI